MRRVPSPAPTRAASAFEQAEGGTLFLDEIGDMPLEAQTRLLRVLQQGEYTTVGGRAADQDQCAHHRGDQQGPSDAHPPGAFPRGFVLSNQCRTASPSAAARACEDVPDLVRHFFEQGEQEGLQTKRISSGGIELMKRYPWPGNVRELENCCPPYWRRLCPG